MGETERETYRAAALRTLTQVSQRFLQPEGEMGLLGGGVSNMPGHYGVGVSLIYGDYFYVEALLRALGRNRSYWCPDR